MSEENVELVRRLFEAASHGDTESVLSFYDPDVELDSTQAALGRLVGGEVYHGHKGVRRFYRAYDEAWDHLDHDIQELIDAGDHVVSVVNIRARGRVSGAEVELPMSGVWTIQDGRIVRVVYLQSRGEALAAAGLSE
jgi:ketosteroid isomerase-like protein